MPTIVGVISGKLFYDNFDDGNYIGWSILTGTGAVVNYKFRLTRASGSAQSVTPCPVSNNGVVLQARVTLRSGDTSAVYLGFSDDTLNNFYVIAVHCPPGWTPAASWFIAKMVAGIHTNLVTAPENEDINEHVWTMEWDGTTIRFYRDGVLLLTANDSSFSSFSHIYLRGSGSSTSPYDYADFDEICVMKSRYIKCHNLPTGYKFRVTDAAGATFVATESGGTATVDCIAAKFPAVKVEVLDASNVVVDTFTPSDKVWGGDEYQYPLAVALLADTLRKTSRTVQVLADTRRKVSVSVQVLADTLRRVIAGTPVTIYCDTRRIVQASVSVGVDTLRKTLQQASMLADTKRVVSAPASIRADTKRIVSALVQVLVDTRRLVFAPVKGLQRFYTAAITRRREYTAAITRRREYTAAITRRREYTAKLQGRRQD